MLVDDRNQQAALPAAPPTLPPAVVEDRAHRLPIFEDRPQKIPEVAQAQPSSLVPPEVAAMSQPEQAALADPGLMGRVGQVAQVGIPMAGQYFGGPIGGGLAGGAVEAGRQYLQGEAFNPGLIATEAALNAIPLGKGASTIPRTALKRSIQGAALGLGGEQARHTSREGLEGGLISPEQALTSGGLGLVTGGVLGGVEGAAAGKAPLIIEDRPGRVPTNVSTPETLQIAPGATQPIQAAVGSEAAAPPRPAQAGSQPEPFPGAVPDTRSLADQAASPEAISRLQSEQGAGVQFYRQRQAGGPIEPMPPTVDRIDTFAQGDQVVYRMENGRVTIAGTGPDVQRGRLEGTQANFERALRGQLTQPATKPATGLLGYPKTAAPEPLSPATIPDTMAETSGNIPPSTPPASGLGMGLPPKIAAGAPRGKDAGFGPLPPPPRGAGKPPAPGDVQGGRLSAADPDRLAQSLRNIQGPEQIRQIQDEVATQIRDNIEFARRGKVPIEQTFKEAEDMGLEQVLDRKRGEAWNAAQLAGADRVRKATLGNLTDAWQAARANPSDETRVELMKQVYLTHAVLQQSAGASAEAGRALQIHRHFAQNPISRSMQAALNRAGGIEFIDQVVDDLAKFDPNDAAGMEKYVGALAKATNWEKAHEWFLASITSGPQTHLANILGNTAFALERPALRPVSAAIDVARAKFTGTPRERFFGEAGADIRAMGRAAGRQALAPVRTGIEAYKADELSAAHGLRAGVTAALHSLAQGETQTKLGPHYKQAIGGTLGKVIRGGLTALGIEDDFFKGINVHADLAGRAYRQAAKEGLTGRAFTNRMAEIMSRPDAIEGLREQLDAEALYRTLQTPGGPFTRAISAARRSAKIGPFILPFLQVSSNVFGRTIERSPFALVDILRRVNQGTLRGGELSDEVAKAAVGTAIGAAVVAAVKAGLMTGNLDADPRARAAERAVGRQPYSFLVPKDVIPKAMGGNREQWVNYGRIEPWGSVVGWAADLGDLITKGEIEAEDAIAKTAAMFAHGLTSKTWLDGLDGFFQVLHDPKRNLNEFMNRFAGSMAVPNVINQLGRAVDPVLRKPRTIRETLQSRVGLGGGLKGYLDEVGPFRDVFGEAITMPGGPLERVFNPIYRSPTKTEDRARAEVARLGYSPGSPQKQLAGVKLSPKEYDGYVERSGKLAHTLISKLVSGQGYQRLSDDDKQDALARVFAEARHAEREKLKPSILRRAQAEGFKPKR